MHEGISKLIATNVITSFGAYLKVKVTLTGCGIQHVVKVRGFGLQHMVKVTLRGCYIQHGVPTSKVVVTEIILILVLGL